MPRPPLSGHAQSDPVFIALADPTRRGMLERLADGPATITELHTGLPISRQAASKHLRVLADAGLVTGHKAGREHRYTLAPGSFAPASGWLAAVERRWDDRIAALRRLVEAERAETPFDGSPTESR